VGGAQLPGERRALLAHLALALMLLGGELRAPCGALGALAAHLGERRAHLADRELGTLELGGELVALDLLGAHLSGDPLDLGLDRPQLRFRLPGIGLRAPGPGSAPEPPSRRTSSLCTGCATARKGCSRSPPRG